ncbi:hypothetical protein [Lysobacter sp. Root604]|uniref:hypothetical protein n=1 Tax=Lysobacter sp. Root604 TaxID=1736568 RepID=UPI0007023586|nr:hypothetical protein [Lysobacter sp. Root604]KRA15018.1 hypothetical protein ASD69_19340 [Lysobacter sp. Root604]
MAKSLIALICALVIGIPLASASSLLLDVILDSRGIAGAAGGLFASGIMAALATALLGGLLFAHMFAFHPNRVARVALGLMLGVITGLLLAITFIDEASVRLLGVSFFLGYGALWGAFGGAVYALVIRRVLLVLRVPQSTIALPSFVRDKNLTVPSVVALAAACIPIVVGGSATPSHQAHIVTASFDTCLEAKRAKAMISVPEDSYDVRIIHAINGRYAVSVGAFEVSTARNALVAAAGRGLIPRDSFLLNASDVLKDHVLCASD